MTGGALPDWSRFSTDPRHAEGLRASDADRDVLLELLREAYADGRLRREEHDLRAEQALAVRTLGEVVPLLQDLLASVPGTPARRVGVRAEAEQAYVRERRDARNGLVFVGLLTTGIWAATSLASGDPHFFWPVFPILGIGLGYVSIVLNRESRTEALEDKVAERRRRRRELD